MISRKTPLSRSKHPRKVNPKRRKSEFARCYHSKERVKFVRSLACCVCSARPSENAHIVNGGMGRKADYDQIAPLCTFHHRQLHSVGRVRFENNHLVSLAVAASSVEWRWWKHASELEESA